MEHVRRPLAVNLRSDVIVAGKVFVDSEWTLQAWQGKKSTERKKKIPKDDE